MSKAFSLVELSIVLVILGLLTGGILSGQSLIRAAELRSVTTEYQTYQIASQTFEDEYMALPGDMPDATLYWGAADPTPATCLSAVGTGTQTCNGDGDNLVEASGTTGQYSEIFTFWQHLANAGLIEGAYTGRATAAGAWGGDVSVNLPKSRLGNAGWSAAYSTTGAIFLDLLTVPKNTMLLFGKATPNELTWGRIIKAKESWKIDTKIDDGKPGMGVMQSFNNTRYPTCADSNVAQTAQYDVDSEALGCSIVFMEF
jgi:prepilin-type N-terminal cleavage/methylation domain-containing protein